jgi:Uma2 family endonuclease
MASSSATSLRAHFLEMEARLEKEPDSVQAEIALGVYLMSPRPRPRHGGAQARLVSVLHQRFGSADATGRPPDWFFAIEPEIRSERAFSRLVPDVAGWRRSTSGWPDLDATPVALAPEWVAEVLSPSTASVDRGAKSEAYGVIGVGWLWLVDADRRVVETFENVRGRMVAGPVFGPGQAITGEPFGGSALAVDPLFD